ncbi:hypothetical protein [Falsiporphyromonas endometrii]|uniref:Uncharacterized protein n=1 Tax=Falsiporphyromonas endometrii TaxID=1387297 RepID=A0ABV9K7Y9_9PORP
MVHHISNYALVMGISYNTYTRKATKYSMLSLIIAAIISFQLTLAYGQPEVKHSTIQEECLTSDGGLRLTITNKHQQFDWQDRSTLDKDIYSPKSVKILPDNSKYYVNSLEGCCTVVYDLKNNKKLKVIQHTMNYDKLYLWNNLSGLFPFRKYMQNVMRFRGKPVESTLTHNAKYFWVTYYKRSFDINAQEPSAIAVIDTDADSIVRMMECGPLPKMIATSNDNKTVAVTHWGNNTVGLIDCSSDNPKQWHYTGLITVLEKYTPDFSTTTPINRDFESGLKLRGTIFLPGDRYLLVGCMTGGYGIAVIDVIKRQYIGRITGMYSSPRHLIVSKGDLYCSCNISGYVAKIALKDIEQAIQKMQKGSKVIELGWHNCKVGKGARTIVASPDGKYIFVTCNNDSKLDVIDADKMQVVGRMTIDSFPVGLAISSDGHHLIVTSQGIDKMGGNAVNIIKIDYLKKAIKEIENREDKSKGGDSTSNDFAKKYWLIALLSILSIIAIFNLAIKKKDNYQ